MSEVDRWRTVSAVLAAACILLGLQLWSVGARLQWATAHRLSATVACPMSLEDLEHS